VVKDKKIAGLYVGSPETTWNEAANLSSKLNIVYVDRPYTKVLSVMPEMYEDIWTAAKGMYKLENVVADGGEVIIYAPRISEISYTHGHLIDQIGYHVKDYFVERWDDFKDYPWCVLAHSTHLRGVGTFINKIECPRINVTLATRIPRKRCEQLRLGYRDPDEIEPEMWYGRQSEGILVVPDAGEILYRLKSQDN
jgi:nickel-dependent lactate racemase